MFNVKYTDKCVTVFESAHTSSRYDNGNYISPQKPTILVQIQKKQNRQGERWNLHGSHKGSASR